MTQRWTFTDAVTFAVWRLPRNPRVMASIHPNHKTTVEVSNTIYLSGTFRALRSGDIAFPWEFKGRIHTQEEYDTFLEWRDKGQVIVTDHLARQHLVVPTAFQPTPFPRNGTQNAWLYEYTFKAVYLRRLP